MGCEQKAMKETIERSKVINARAIDTIEFRELDGISTFKANNIQQLSGQLYVNKDAHGNAVRYLAYGTCALLGWKDGLSTPIAHHIVFREQSDHTIFVQPTELDTFAALISSEEPVVANHAGVPRPEVDLSFRDRPEQVEILFNNLVNFQPELAISLEEEGRLVAWMSSTFGMLSRRARQFEGPPYSIGAQAWGEAMMEYLKDGPQKEKHRVLSEKRKDKMWAVIMGME